MAYQLSKTGAQINIKLQELTVRTLTANGNIAATDGVVILDATSAECTKILKKGQAENVKLVTIARV